MLERIRQPQGPVCRITGFGDRLTNSGFSYSSRFFFGCFDIIDKNDVSNINRGSSFNGGEIMKKVLIFILTVILISFSVLGYTAKQDTCVLLIADTDMKAEDYVNKIKECLQGNPNVDFGTHIQTKYQDLFYQQH